MLILFTVCLLSTDSRLLCYQVVVTVAVLLDADMKIVDHYWRARCLLEPDLH